MFMWWGLVYIYQMRYAPYTTIFIGFSQKNILLMTTQCLGSMVTKTLFSSVPNALPNIGFAMVLLLPTVNTVIIKNFFLRTLNWHFDIIPLTKVLTNIVYLYFFQNYQIFLLRFKNTVSMPASRL